MKRQEPNIIAVFCLFPEHPAYNPTLSLLGTHSKLKHFSHTKLQISVSHRMAFDFPKREEDQLQKRERFPLTEISSNSIFLSLNCYLGPS